jgi:predicted DNA-binding transcriptional regulator AlpA
MGFRNERPRKAMRKPAVLAATGWSDSTLYRKIAEGRFPKGTKIDPAGRVMIWWEDEILAFQARADAAE